MRLENIKNLYPGISYFIKEIDSECEYSLMMQEAIKQSDLSPGRKEFILDIWEQRFKDYENRYIELKIQRKKIIRRINNFLYSIENQN
jgi:hypothetical protein